MVFLSIPNNKLPTSIARITTLATLPPYIRQVTSNRPSFVDVTIEQQEIATRPRPGKNPHILYQEYIYHRSDMHSAKSAVLYLFALKIEFKYGGVDTRVSQTKDHLFLTIKLQAVDQSTVQF